MAQKPLVSIVTPSFNQARFLGENLRSVALQASPEFDLEHLVIDGGSTDGSVDILRESTGITWVSEQDRGQSHAINKGFKRSAGAIIGWLNSDDAYLPGAVLTAVRFLSARPEVAMVYGDCYFIDDDGRRLWSYDARHFDLDTLINYGDFIPQQSVFFRREVFKDIGFLDESLHLAMDYDYWIRIGKQFAVSYVPIPLANFRRHNSAKTSQQASGHWSEALKVSRKHGGRRFSRLFFRAWCHVLYRCFPAGIRGLARRPVVGPIARLIR